MSEQQGIRVGVNAAIVRDQAILLVEFDDAQSGLHYNLPGGGVHAGETLHAALRRAKKRVRRLRCAGCRLLIFPKLPSFPTPASN